VLYRVYLNNGEVHEVDALSIVGAELRALALHDEEYNNGESDFSVVAVKSELIKQ
jgi:hypothetical protein